MQRVDPQAGRVLAKLGIVARRTEHKTNIALEALRQVDLLVALVRNRSFDPVVTVHGKILKLHIARRKPELPAAAGHVLNAKAGHRRGQLHIEHQILLIRVHARARRDAEHRPGGRAVVMIPLRDLAVNYNRLAAADSCDGIAHRDLRLGVDGLPGIVVGIADLAVPCRDGVRLHRNGGRLHDRLRGCMGRHGDCIGAVDGNVGEVPLGHKPHAAELQRAVVAAVACAAEGEEVHGPRYGLPGIVAVVVQPPAAVGLADAQADIALEAVGQIDLLVVVGLTVHPAFAVQRQILIGQLAAGGRHRAAIETDAVDADARRSGGQLKVEQDILLGNIELAVIHVDFNERGSILAVFSAAGVALSVRTINDDGFLRSDGGNGLARRQSDLRLCAPALCNPVIVRPREPRGGLTDLCGLLIGHRGAEPRRLSRIAQSGGFAAVHFDIAGILLGNKPRRTKLQSAVIAADPIRTEHKVDNLCGHPGERGSIGRRVELHPDITLEALGQIELAIRIRNGSNPLEGIQRKVLHLHTAELRPEIGAGIAVDTGKTDTGAFCRQLKIEHHILLRQIKFLPCAAYGKDRIGLVFVAEVALFDRAVHNGNFVEAENAAAAARQLRGGGGTGGCLRSYPRKFIRVGNRDQRRIASGIIPFFREPVAGHHIAGPRRFLYGITAG